MGALATEAFTGTGALSASWTQETGVNTFNRSSDVAVPANMSQDCGAFNNTVTWPNDQYAQAKVSATGTNALTGIGVACRMASGARTHYWAIVNKAASSNVTLQRFNAGTPSTIAQFTTTWNDGDVLRLEVSGAPTSVSLKVFQNGVQLGTTQTDSNASGLSSGNAGIAYSSSLTSGSLDDWEGGDLVSTVNTNVTP